MVSLHWPLTVGELVQSSQKRFVNFAKQDPGRAGSGRTGKQEKKQISRNHVQTIYGSSVQLNTSGSVSANCDLQIHVQILRWAKVEWTQVALLRFIHNHQCTQCPWERNRNGWIAVPSFPSRDHTIFTLADAVPMLPFWAHSSLLPFLKTWEGPYRHHRWFTRRGMV